MIRAAPAAPAYQALKQTENHRKRHESQAPSAQTEPKSHQQGYLGDYNGIDLHIICWKLELLAVGINQD